jgi:hypothetical protein
MESISTPLPEIPVKNFRDTHLEDGVKPITVCLSSEEDLLKDKNYVLFIDKKFKKSKKSINVDFQGSKDYFKKEKIKNNGEGTYLISKIDDSDKFTENLYDCTTLVVVGTEEDNKKQISFISHQDPKSFLNSSNKDEFISDLEQSLNEIKNKCKPGTIDAIFVGGLYKNTYSVLRREVNINPGEKNYINSIELISAEVKKTLGFTPPTINGPKIIKGPDSVFFENDNRFRPANRED